MAWQDYQHELPENLVEYIQLKDDQDFAQTARDAFIALTMTFQQLLLKRLIPLCRNWGYDRDYAIDLGERVFGRVWKYPKYSGPSGKEKEPAKSFVFYLLGIAKNLLADDRKSEQNAGSHWTGEEEIIWEFPDLGPIDGEIERKAKLIEKYELIKRALDRLGPKHKVIYLTYKQYEEELKSGGKLPRQLLEKLRDSLDLTQTSVRVYKKQAFDTVDEYLKIYGSK